MQSHHTKKPESLKCSDCQEYFENQKSLKNHATTVDCEICCPYCDETFSKKATRTAHLNGKHPEGGNTSVFKEMDDALWKKLKENLKAFADSLRKGKGPQDPKFTKWIEQNTSRYMIGRPANSNPILELGQWYITFHTLSMQEHIPEHPCKCLTTQLHVK